MYSVRSASPPARAAGSLARNCGATVLSILAALIAAAPPASCWSADQQAPPAKTVSGQVKALKLVSPTETLLTLAPNPAPVAAARAKKPAALAFLVDPQTQVTGVLTLGVTVTIQFRRDKGPNRAIKIEPQSRAGDTPSLPTAAPPRPTEKNPPKPPPGPLSPHQGAVASLIGEPAPWAVSVSSDPSKLKLIGDSWRSGARLARTELAVVTAEQTERSPARSGLNPPWALERRREDELIMTGDQYSRAVGHVIAWSPSAVILLQPDEAGATLKRFAFTDPTRIQGRVDINSPVEVFFKASDRGNEALAVRRINF